MSGDTSRTLTDKQQAVMERIDRRVPIKVIARELEVSETRINQHIRALKNIYEVESLGDLVEAYRAEKRAKKQAEACKKANAEQALAKNLKGLDPSPYRKSQLPDAAQVADNGARINPGELVLSDASPLENQAPWLRTGEPRVVPRALDGEYAVWLRLFAIVGIAFGVLAAVVLTITAATVVSEALEGRAVVPVDKRGFT